ncbi:MAG: SMR family transporter [Thermoanaerobaculia bacterium]
MSGLAPLANTVVLRSWIFLVASSGFQVGWLLSLKESHGFTRLLPMVGYVLFGLGSAMCLSRSLEGLSLSTAYAAWTGISVAGSVLADSSVLNRQGAPRLLCILVILAGATGLKLTEAAPR